MYLLTIVFDSFGMGLGLFPVCMYLRAYIILYTNPRKTFHDAGSPVNTGIMSSHDKNMSFFFS